MVVHLAFGDPPLTANASATWTDVSAYVEGSDGIDHMIRRGRNHERDENEAGTAIVVLRNTDRRFDPANSSGPYLGDIQPMTKIRIGALWSATTYWMFYGYVESWLPEYPGGSVSTCTLECVDAFKYFGLIDVYTYGNRPQEVSGDRISEALDVVSWPAAERSIAVGDIDVAEMQLDASALSIMQQVTLAERGSLYVSRSGNVTFEDRSWRDAAVSLETWGDAADGSELPYEPSLSIRYDDSDIFNRIEVTRSGGITQTVEDTGSQAAYFVRTFRSSGLPYVDDAAALEAAETMLDRYKDARFRLDRMVIDPGVRDTWVDVLERELSDMITVTRRTLVDGHTLTLDAHIEAIEWHITKGMWRCTWQLSPHFGAPTLGSGTLNTTDDWLVPTLLNGWVNFSGSAVPAGYRKEGDWVYLRGFLKDGIDNTIFTLPVGYRPPYTMHYPVVTTTAGTSHVNVTSSGGVVGNPAVVVDGQVDLSGIFFRVI
jgi:hypothetical protein